MVDFNIINFDVSILGNHYAAKFGTSTALTSTGTVASNRGPAVVTPWAEENETSLSSRYSRIRNKTNFIDENTSAVREAGFDKDNKALFTLYAAVNDLRTIAEYAADGNKSENVIAGLSSQFQTGLSQVDQYIRQAELDKLILQTNEKSSYVTSGVSLGKNNSDIQGTTVKAINKDTAIVGINGDETFTINLTKGSEQDDIVIDLSEIDGTISLNKLRNLINSKIADVTEVNDDGNTVSKYKSRIQIDENDDGDFSFRFEVDGIEKINFSTDGAEPALIITGTNRSSDFGAITTGTITKYSNLDGSGIQTSFSHEIAAVDGNGFVIPATDEDEEDTNSIQQTRTTTPVDVQVDSNGNSYVVGTTEGNLNGQVNGAQTSDVFLSKYDSNGNLLWSRLVGASNEAEGFDLEIDGDDNVYIAGKTNEELISSDVFSGTDSFVTKFDSAGQELWTRQLDTITTDQANNLTVDDNGDVYFTGQVSGRLNTSTSHIGGTDGIAVKLSGNTGLVLQTAQFGTASNDSGSQIAIADDGNILIASEENGQAVIRKLDKDNLSSTLATYNLGSLNGGEISGLHVDGDDVYISGTTQNGSLNGGAVTGSYNGGKDGFVTKLSDNGGSISADFTNYIGTSSTDSVDAITVHNGAIYIAGSTGGTLAGENKTGLKDHYTSKIDATTGITEWQEQLKGTTGYNENAAIAFVENGSSVLDKIGLPTGTVDNSQTHDIETQSSVRAGDHFYISIDGGRQRKIEIREGDTFNILATRINATAGRYLKASVTIGDNGPELKLAAQNGATVDLISGKNGRDALTKLGFKEQSIIATEILFDLDEDNLGADPNKLGGSFSFGLNTDFSFSNKTEAEYILTQLDNALETIQRAHRSLTYDPAKAELLRQAQLNTGEAPAHLQAQLARYQDGLQRVLAVTGGTVI